MRFLDCEHDDEGVIVLMHQEMTVEYCRECGRWATGLKVPLESAFNVFRSWGLDSYRQKIEDYAREHEEWDATFLHDLGGHAAEVEAGE